MRKRRYHSKAKFCPTSSGWKGFFGLGPRVASAFASLPWADIFCPFRTTESAASFVSVEFRIRVYPCPSVAHSSVNNKMTKRTHFERGFDSNPGGWGSQKIDRAQSDLPGACRSKKYGGGRGSRLSALALVGIFLF